MKSEIIKKTLPNGLKVIFLKNKQNTITLNLNVLVGSVNETKKTNGISHFVEHMVFQGTKYFSSNEIIEKLNQIPDSYYNGSTSLKRTSFTLTGSKKYFKDLMNILSQIIQYPLFNQKEIERERKVILDEFNRYQDDNLYIFYNRMHQEMFKNSPLGKSVLGTKKNIKNFNRNQLIRFFNKYYTPNNMILVISGNLENPFLTVKEYFNKPRKKLVSKKIKTLKNISKNKTIKINKNLKTKNIALGFLGSKSESKDNLILELIEHIITANNKYNITNNLRQKHGFSYAVNTSYHTYKENGLFIINTTYSYNDINKVKKLLIDQIKELKNISSKELNQIINKVNKFYNKIDQYPSLLSEKVLRKEAYGYKKIYNERIPEIKQITNKDVSRVINKYFNKYITIVID
jgi:predicted Zn-dependent peptidase